MNIAGLIALHGRYRPERIALEAGERTLSYGELDVMVRRIAARLKGAGIVVGDVVGVLMRDVPEQVAAQLAIARCGATVLPLDWRWTDAEIQRAVRRFAPRAVMVDEPPSAMIAVPLVGIEGLAGTAPDDGPPATIRDVPLFHSLSSGSTGEPKAAILTHEVMFARMFAVVSESPLLRDDRYLLATPLAHGAGHFMMLYFLAIAAAIVMAPPITDGPALARLIRERRISAAIIVPTQTRLLLDVARARAADEGADRLLPDLRLYITSTAALHPHEREAIRTLLAPNVVDMYGSVATGLISIGRVGDPDQPPGSVGRPAAVMDAEIVDDRHEPLPPGEVGLLRVRGDAVATGFVNLPDESAERLFEGWCYTGDVASIDAKGFITLHGRTAEVLKVGGRSVFAVEIERVIATHPAVAEAAVVGAPTADLDQEVVAFVVLREPVDVRTIAAHCRRELAPYKAPRRIYVVDRMPRNANQKVVKAQLLDLLAPPA